MLSLAKYTIIAFLVLIAAPLAVHGAVHWRQGWPESWSRADWSSAGILPKAEDHRPAMVRIFAARTGRWKGIFAVHTWIVVKDKDADSYQRFDVVGWGTPLRVNAYAPDARWFGDAPREIYAADGELAERLIPKIRAAVDAYPYRHPGDYRIWPGPNSNTFVAAILAAVPEIDAVLPPTAIGKDYPLDGRIFTWLPDGWGFRLSWRGYGGLTLGWREGIEVSILGAVIGVDFRRPALKLPGFGLVGFPG